MPIISKNSFDFYPNDFKCKVVDGDCVRPLALTYHVQANMWTVEK